MRVRVTSYVDREVQALTSVTVALNGQDFTMRPEQADLLAKHIQVVLTRAPWYVARKRVPRRDAR